VATSTLAADTDALSGESKDLVLTQQKLITQEGVRSAAWTERSNAALKETKQTSAEAHAGAKSTLSTVVATSQETNTELNNGNDKVLELKDRYASSTADALKQSASYLATRTSEHNTQANTADTAIAASADVFKKSMVLQHKNLDAKHDSLKSEVQSAAADVKKGADRVSDDTTEAEADSVNYVMQEIERDTLIAPAKKSYTYPDEFVETDPYVFLSSAVYFPFFTFIHTICLFPPLLLLSLMCCQTSTRAPP
jgi:hypothetical protein